MNQNNQNRVTVKVVPRGNDDNSNNKMRQDLHVEINSFKVSIDRSVFKKTPAEKETLKALKKEWKKSQSK
jgi:hypothetical protein